MEERAFKPNLPKSERDRRKSLRFESAMAILIRLSPDGTPMNGSAIEMGPNGMRLVTKIPLVEAAYVHISFQNASNNTHCEGRIVWTQTAEDDPGLYECGVDIQRWGGGIPGQEGVQKNPILKPKKDRRKKRR